MKAVVAVRDKNSSKVEGRCPDRKIFGARGSKVGQFFW